MGYNKMKEKSDRAYRFRWAKAFRLLIASVGLVQGAFASMPVFFISEKSLLSLKEDHAPEWAAIEAGFLAVETESMRSSDRFKPVVFGAVQQERTREKPILDFFPVWSPLTTAQVGVRQKLRGGVNFSASLGANQRSALTPTNHFRDISTSIMRFDVEIDLWKDLFGKVSKAEDNAFDFKRQKAELEKKIRQHIFRLGIRRLYWSLVVNNEQIRIYQDLKKTSDQQLEDAKNRQKAGITDLGEVSRYEAQVASREGSILYYQFQKEQLLKQLKILLPELQDKSLSLGPYRIPETIDSVLACTKVISSKKQTPFDFTLYDEVIELLLKSQSEQQKVAASYSDIDLKLIGSIRTTGVSSRDLGGGIRQGSYKGAFEDWLNNDRKGYTLGLQLTVPLGLGKTSDALVRLNQNQFFSEIQKTNALVHSTHEQIVPVIQYLAQIVESQKRSKLALQKRIEVQNRKYREARLTVNELIFDQDALLNTDLSSLNTQLEIIHTLFDYLAVFTETPCAFNENPS
jgi:outer membrane protein TolC